MAEQYNFTQDLDQPTITYTNTCFHCANHNHIQMNLSDYERWKQHNTYIQVVFPWLSPDQRELIVSGTHPHCWNEMFPEELDDTYYLESLDARNNHPSPSAK